MKLFNALLLVKAYTDKKKQRQDIYLGLRRVTTYFPLCLKCAKMLFVVNLAVYSVIIQLKLKIMYLFQRYFFKLKNGLKWVLWE